MDMAHRDDGQQAAPKYGFSGHNALLHGIFPYLTGGVETGNLGGWVEDSFFIGGPVASIKATIAVRG
jgi:hypothetical protein